MVTAFIATVLILGIATYQAVHGVYSALIMAVLTILSALTALALYEPFCQGFLYQQLGAHAEGVALISPFLLILLGTRELADRFLRGNLVLGVWPDRIGGGALGLLAGIVIVGIVSVGLQLLPFGRSAAGYTPCDESLRRTAGLWMFYPDDFVLSMAKRLSRGALGQDRPFEAVHYDLVQEAYCTRNRLITGVRDSDKKDVPTLAGTLNGADGDFRVKTMHALSNADVSNSPLYEKALTRIQAAGLKDPTLPDGTDTTLVSVRVGVRDGASDKDGLWRLPATHFRLVDPEGKPHYPVGYLFVYREDQVDIRHRGEPCLKELESWNLVSAPTKTPPDGTSTAGRLRIADLVVQRNRADGDKEGLELFVDWVFCLPKSLLEDKSLAGWHMVFRGHILAKFEDEKIDPKFPTPNDALRHAYLELRKAKAGPGR
ncbi:MAG: hypothetical protein NTV86_04195 [Planctomycetota bacterium]|nr:hypothetical protein [Planctomycetota bacterium]